MTQFGDVTRFVGVSSDNYHKLFVWERGNKAVVPRSERIREQFPSTVARVVLVYFTFWGFNVRCSPNGQEFVIIDGTSGIEIRNFCKSAPYFRHFVV